MNRIRIGAFLTVILSITAGDAGYIVGAAVAGLCPEYLPLMGGDR